VLCQNISSLYGNIGDSRKTIFATPGSDSIPKLDTICLPVANAKKVYGDALKYRYTDSLLKLCEAQLAEKRLQLQLMEDKEGEVANNHRREIANLEGQIGTLKEQVNGFERMWRKERRQRRLSQAGGVLAVAAAIYLSTK
jgi:hypothetical protein